MSWQTILPCANHIWTHSVIRFQRSCIYNVLWKDGQRSCPSIQEQRETLTYITISKNALFIITAPMLDNWQDSRKQSWNHSNDDSAQFLLKFNVQSYNTFGLIVSEKIFFKFLPIRNKNCQWQPYFSPDPYKIRNFWGGSNTHC